MTGNQDKNKTTTLVQTTNIPEFSPNQETWFIWKEKLDIHLCEINASEENTKKSILLKSIGASSYSLLHSLCSPQTPVSKTFKELCEILETHFTPPTIIFRERKNFYLTKKNEDETISQWFAKVKKLALNCKFGSNLDAFVLDKFVMGLPNKIYERICEEDENLTLSDALKKALIMESKISSREDNTCDVSVNYIKKTVHNTRWSKNRNVNTERNISERNGNKNNNNNYSGSKNYRIKCIHCGWTNHKSNMCKFKSSSCHNCGKIGHLSTVCRNKKSINFINNSNNLNNNLNNNFNDHFDFSICSVSSSSNANMYSLPVEIDGVYMTIACDTGSPCTLMPISLFKKHFYFKKLKKCKIPYLDYSGGKIEVIGEYTASIKYKDIKKQINIVVTNTENPPLIGRKLLREFNFKLTQINSIKINEKYSIIIEQIKSEFTQVFSDELGSYNVTKISLPICENAKPVFLKPRSVPFAWKNKIEKQLRDLIQKDVLEPVDNSDWGTPLVPILKPNGDIRICGDYKVTINKFLMDFKYPLPRIEEIFASLEGGELFTKLDLSNAYNQLMLDEKSQLLCTWSTQIGTLKMKRLPFGVKPAAAIFQKTMENLLRGIPYVVVYQDDITISGKNFEQHIQTLKSVLNKLQSSGLKLNLRKCAFFQNEISYLGFKIDKYGLSKTDERISSILKAPEPKNISEVRAIIGMVNYYSKFVDKFAKKMSPLYQLLQKGVKFNWSKECQKAFDVIKKDITSDQVLVHFNPKLPIVLTTDACNNAVAGVLSHKFPDNQIKPIAFISRALTKTEKNYSTLEKEALAIIFSLTKLKQYLIGNKFIIRTDHKPLITILGEHKSLPIMAAARMQRWAFILSGFNYSIEYIKGKRNEADELSRFPQMDSIELPEENSYINYIDKDDSFRINFKSIANETRRDPILSKVCDAIQKGTIKNLNDIQFKSFKNKELELTVELGCILWGYRTVVPSKLRETILQELHKAHLGIVKTKALARSYIWWPKIDTDIENIIKNCLPCQELQSSPEKSALISWMPSDSVWSRIHIDFAGPIKNHYLLIVVDSFSKWTEIFKTKDITSSFTISKLRELFCRYGLVDILVSDNGTQFTSDEFKNFMKANDIIHKLTSPGNPSTNGQAENSVKMIKKSIYAILKEKNQVMDLEITINRFLVDYRNTKHCTTGESPAKLFFGRSLKTRFSKLKPPLIKNNIIKSQFKAQENYKGKRNVEFYEGQEVYIRNYKNPNKPSWSPAIINKKLGPRSYYCIFSHNNKEIKRHLNQIRDANQKNMIEHNNVQNMKIEQNVSLPHANNSSSISTADDADERDMFGTSAEIHNEQQNEIVSTPRKLRPRIDGRVAKN